MYDDDEFNKQNNELQFLKPYHWPVHGRSASPRGAPFLCYSPNAGQEQLGRTLLLLWLDDRHETSKSTRRIGVAVVGM
jgi:hypothetical protein